MKSITYARKVSNLCGNGIKCQDWFVEINLLIRPVFLNYFAQKKRHASWLFLVQTLPGRIYNKVSHG